MRSPRRRPTGWLVRLASVAALAWAPAALATAPAPPTGCAFATTSVSNTTPVPIPDVATATSTITVSGVTGSIVDVDAVTNIIHTYTADLEITLTSPAGTVVTLSKTNGGGNDNVFNGTTWDDDANPAGQVPYLTNNGVTTDNAYTNNVTATPLAPQEPLGAFIGENPNGTWTLAVTDNASLDTGSLASWSLDVTTSEGYLAAPAGASMTTPAAVAITDNAVTTSTIEVSGAATYLSDVNVLTNITHTASADLDITLTSPAGTVVTLTTDNASVNDDVFNGTTWDDGADDPATLHAYVNLTTASPLAPEEPLAAFIGENPNGTWTLTISDDQATQTGMLNSWSLAFETAGCGADLGVAVTDTPDPVASGSNVTYDVTATNNGPSEALDAHAVLALAPEALFVSATPSAGGSCVTPTVGQSGTIDCTWAGGTSVGATRTVSVIATTTTAGTLTATANTTSTSSDPTPANNTANATSTVLGAVTATISSPAGGATYTQGQAVPTTFTCAVVGGTPVSCADDNGGSGTSGTLNTATAGAHTYTVTATDKLGRTAKASITYTVNATTVTSPPATPPAALKLQITGTPKTVKAGATMKVTLTVTNTGGKTAMSRTHATSGVNVCTAIPAGTTVANRGGGTVSKQRICWNVGAVNPGATVTRSYTLRTSATSTTNRTVTLTATAASTDTTQAVARATARTSVRVLAARTAAPTPAVTG